MDNVEDIVKTYILKEFLPGEAPETLTESTPLISGGIVDSIQTLFSEEVPSGPGSVAQVREAGLRLTRWAKIRKAPNHLNL